MSSWISGTRRQRLRLGYRQEKPLGLFPALEPDAQVSDATVVSAYYELPSKYNPASYKKWVRLFLENCPCNLVFFTDDAQKEFIEDCRKGFKERTKIVILPREEWVFERGVSPEIWKEQSEFDPERSIHSIPLYKVWNEKKEFVKRAIKMDPFKSDAFVWIDAGFVRSEGLAKFMQGFPHAGRIPVDRVLLLSIGEYTEKDNYPVNIAGQEVFAPHGKMRIGGGIIAAYANNWAKFDAAYNDQVEKYARAGLFFGKEQNILGSLVLEHKDLFSLVEPKPIGPEAWFYLGLWLSAPPRMWAAMNDEARNTMTASYETLWSMCE